ncbi:hypothetical protein DBV15_04125 [Temnothorax longispinosus]|uniref:Uncharacterized protein n=1 Tax=Temnothorax longispinosus TaxID=300112 RepID=A0A4S2KCC3_9HYME|nr:hypothetical protein DBV15_04125 [Temnothorax longispinosus]
MLSVTLVRSMGYKNLHLLILAFVVVYVQAVPDKTTDLIASNLEESITKSLTDMMDTDIMKYIKSLFYILFKIINQFAPEEYTTAMTESYNCFLEYEEKMLSCLVKMVVNFILAVMFLFKLVPNISNMPLATIFDIINSITSFN